jgi:hypothetical protein
MIPTTLKPGAKVRCVARTSGLVDGQIYTVIGYNPNCGYGGERTSVLLADVKTAHTTGDRGWMRYRFEVVSDGDGSDYQGPDDVDLN